MAVSDSYREFVIGQLEGLAPVRWRRMFGEIGLYAGDLFFAIIADDTLYFKADAATIPAFERLGMRPFAPFGPEARPMSYYAVPAEAIEDPDELKPWLDDALAVAARAAKPKRSRRS